MQGRTLTEKEAIKITNPGLIDYQKNNKEVNIQIVKDTIEMMHQSGIKVNVASLAKECGLSRPTLYRDYMKEFLSQYPEFKKDLILHTEHEKGFSEERYASICLERDNLALRLIKAIEKNDELKEKIKYLKQEIDNEKATSMLLRGRYIKEELSNRV